MLGGGGSGRGVREVAVTCGDDVRAELERTTKMESENDSENAHFLHHSHLDSWFPFQK